MRGQQCTYQGINVGKIVLNRVYMEDNIVQSRVNKGIRVYRAEILRGLLKVYKVYRAELTRGKQCAYQSLNGGNSVHIRVYMWCTSTWG